ncbi:hypothetical protein CLV78_1029 [Aliiruegeria haliotis]|uniref:Uncharacterized protein n=1 Tax=Aliiruegeria haliotis TaxID=1280846 RepID=A0A2T0RUG6_9RHOB|nr:hypothetical protein [Aliiruegeria haliotis]PRY24839.1 hypothetical protein CLV78_1029 [Aliiruegeria haliotis]
MSENALIDIRRAVEVARMSLAQQHPDRVGHEGNCIYLAGVSSLALSCLGKISTPVVGDAVVLYLHAPDEALVLACGDVADIAPNVPVGLTRPEDFHVWLETPDEVVIDPGFASDLSVRGYHPPEDFIVGNSDTLTPDWIGQHRCCQRKLA